jgi:glycine reductase complex component B subunit gamma
MNAKDEKELRRALVEKALKALQTPITEQTVF